MLTVVPTPIGNLSDITLRALEALKQADIIVCEDTRQTQKLLQHYGIVKQLLSYHDHSTPQKTAGVVALLREGKRLALVSDGGMPLISDPGFQVVHAALEEQLPLEVLRTVHSFDPCIACAIHVTDKDGGDTFTVKAK